MNAERIFHGLVSFTSSLGWIRREYGDGAVQNRMKLLTLRSPRGPGSFNLDTIAMPRDMGAFGTNRLHALLDGAGHSRTAMGKAPRDDVVWTEGGISCAGRSFVPDAAALALVEKVYKEHSYDLPKRVQRWASAFRRDWYVACGSDMANVWYDATDEADVTADVADCEAMIRSIRFE